MMPIHRSNLELLTVTYYDDYGFDWNYGGTLANPSSVNSFGQTLASSTKGLPIGSKIKVLDGNQWIISYTAYDTKRRSIYSASFNEMLGTTDVAKTQLDFTGNVLQTETTHTKSGQSSIVTVDTFIYDQQNRLLSQAQSINGQNPETIVANSYDDIGQLERKSVGGLQDVDYNYNIRGWMSGINDGVFDNAASATNDLFSFKINYDQTDIGSSSTALYNGNISETLWRTANADDGIKAYRYSYDALNRLTDATFFERGLSATSYTASNAYREKIGSYDKNGNILELYRTGPTVSGVTELWDDLDYSYSGNQLDAVREKNATFIDASYSQQRQEGFLDSSVDGIDYTYDVNGNMLNDVNKGITAITYNHLNLPATVTIDGTDAQGTTQQGTITYTYDATGIKLRKQVASSGVSTAINSTDYAAGYIYENGNLSLLPQPEGYVEPDGSNYRYAYQYKDHLGNIRMTYRENGVNTVVNNTFSTGIEGWQAVNGAVLSNDTGRLKVVTSDNDKGASKTFTVQAR